MLLTDFAKKLMTMTDTKSLSQAVVQLWDLKVLSRDLVKALTDKAIKQKDLVIDVMALEFSKFLQKIDITKEAQKVLEGMTVNFQASFDFKDKDHHTSSKHTAKKTTKTSATRKKAKQTTHKK